MLYINYIPLYFICQHFETIFTEKVRQTSYFFIFNDNNPKCTSCKLLNVNQQIKNGLLFKATNACGIFLQMAKNTDNENNLQRSLFTGCRVYFKIRIYAFFGFISSPIIAPPIIQTAPAICIIVIFSPSKTAAKTTADNGSRYPHTATV